MRGYLKKIFLFIFFVNLFTTLSIIKSATEVSAESLIGVQSSTERSQKVIFIDRFNGKKLKPRLWEVFLNEGSYYFENGFLVIPGGSGLPFFRTKENPFPVSGPFTLEFGIQYLSQKGGGDGVAISFVQQANVSDVNTWPNIPLTYWQDPSGLRLVSYGANAFTISAMDFQYHIVKIVYDGGKYSVLIDGIEVYASLPTPIAGGLWFGHPYYCCPTNGQWTGFKLDYIKVTR